VRVLSVESGAQRVREEVVVAIPPSLVVERDEEQVVALECLQHLLAVAAAGEGVTEWPDELVEDGGVEEKGEHLLGLGAKHLLEEVVEDEPVGARELLHEPRDTAPPPAA